MKRSEPARKRLLTASQLSAMLDRFAREMSKAYGGYAAVVFIGIRSRGPHIAQRVAAIIEKRHAHRVPVGEMDVGLYRDDLNALLPGGTVDRTQIPFDIAGKIVVLFDDVLHTGRTVRAAVDHLMDLGRPRMIHLAVLIDRGGRELPIAAHYIGKKVAARPGADVQVKLKEIDRMDGIWISDAR